MTDYRTSPLADEAPGTAENVSKWNGHTMGGRVPAFLGLAQRTGGVYFENPPDVATALKDTGLDGEVRVEPIQVLSHQTSVNDKGEEVDIVTPVDVPDYRSTVMYHNDGRVVPIAPWVSARYTPVQNPDALGWGGNIADGKLVAVGAYGKPQGAKVYAAFQLAEGMTVGGEDGHDLFLTVINHHDGLGGLSARLAPVRFACTNESPLYFGRGAGKTPKFNLRHTSGVNEARVAQAQAVLELAYGYRDGLQTELEKLLERKVPENRAIVYWRQVFGVPAKPSDWGTERQARSIQAREDQLIEILNSETTKFGRGTAYAAFQAVTEYVDHFVPVRSGSDEAAQAIRQLRTFDGTNDTVKQEAFQLALKAK